MVGDLLLDRVGAKSGFVSSPGISCQFQFARSDLGQQEGLVAARQVVVGIVLDDLLDQIERVLVFAQGSLALARL